MWDDIERGYSFISALAYVGPVIVLVSIAFKIIHFYVQSTPTIIKTLERLDRWYYYPVGCIVLRKRRVDLSFIMLNCIDLALSEKGLKELVGFWCLHNYFHRNMPPGVDWASLPLSESARKKLVKLRGTLRGEPVVDDEEQFS